MSSQLPKVGSTCAELARQADQRSLEKRLAWARAQGLAIGMIYTRVSSRSQVGTGEQVKIGLEHAANMGIYCPVEFVCVEGS